MTGASRDGELGPQAASRKAGYAGPGLMSVSFPSKGRAEGAGLEHGSCRHVSGRVISGAGRLVGVTEPRRTFP